jgi:hypothetical protein
MINTCRFLGHNYNFSALCTPLLSHPVTDITMFSHRLVPCVSSFSLHDTYGNQACTRDARAALWRSQVFPHDQWCLDGKDGKRGGSDPEDELGWPEEDSGRISQAVQGQAGRDGEVEGMFTTTLFYHPVPFLDNYVYHFFQGF